MRQFIGLILVMALVAGIVAVGTPAEADQPNPGTDNGRGRGHEERHPPPCEPCTTLVDATPNKKHDCVFTCEPIPGCVP